MYFEEALYVLDIGQNDLTAGYFLNYTHQQIRDSIPQVLYEFQSHVLALHGQGAKRFMIITTGQLGCLPYILTSIPYTRADLDRYGCAKPYNSMARFFNRELRTTIAKLQQQMPNTTVVAAVLQNLRDSERCA
ncbi:hypothetical protein KP509_1Z119800 [Ceratopteris richardii]|nr:hypothetical protein KP509_1Z119800 [Ceratopteris richardii]